MDFLSMVQQMLGPQQQTKSPIQAGPRRFSVEQMRRGPEQTTPQGPRPDDPDFIIEQAEKAIRQKGDPYEVFSQIRADYAKRKKAAETGMIQVDPRYQQWMEDPEAEDIFLDKLTERLEWTPEIQDEPAKPPEGVFDQVLRGGLNTLTGLGTSAAQGIAGAAMPGGLGHIPGAWNAASDVTEQSSKAMENFSKGDIKGGALRSLASIPIAGPMGADLVERTKAGRGPEAFTELILNALLARKIGKAARGKKPSSPAASSKINKTDLLWGLGKVLAGKMTGSPGVAASGAVQAGKGLLAGAPEAVSRGTGKAAPQAGSSLSPGTSLTPIQGALSTKAPAFTPTPATKPPLTTWTEGTVAGPPTHVRPSAPKQTAAPPKVQGSSEARRVAPETKKVAPPPLRRNTVTEPPENPSTTIRKRIAGVDSSLARVPNKDKVKRGAFGRFEKKN